MLCGMQVWVAFMQDNERWVGVSGYISCCSALGRSKSDILAFLYITLILGCLVLGLFQIASGNHGGVVRTLHYPQRGWGRKKLILS